MTRAKWFTILGAVFLLAGLATAFLSSHYSSRIQGQRRMGAIVFGPEKGSAEWTETEKLLAIADGCFYVGLVLTAIGIVFQTAAAMLSLRTSSRADEPAAREQASEIRAAGNKDNPSDSSGDPPVL